MKTNDRELNVDTEIQHFTVFFCLLLLLLIIAHTVQYWVQLSRCTKIHQKLLSHISEISKRAVS